MKILMKRMTGKLLSCLSVLLFTATTATANNLPIYDQTETDVTVTKQNPSFVLKLSANPTTGYTWILKEYDKVLITPVKHEYQVSKSNKGLVGAPGFDYWTFKVKPAAVVGSLNTKLKMVYVRPWEEGKIAKQIEFVITAKVK
jgi:predicted secreted protein